LRSPAFLGAIIVSLICYPLWLNNVVAALTFSIVPNLLGFSIGGMAVVLAFPTTPIFDLISEDGRDDSYYLDLAAKFVHFVFVQVAALVSAFIASAWSISALSFVALVTLVYAILTAALTALTLFEVAMIYNRSKRP
jgi:hypothetical protein